LHTAETVGIPLVSFTANLPLAELEEAVRNLAGEVEKTKRPVNALEWPFFKKKEWCVC
jgi:vacuolar-type H+-ATPase subunit D/Vma8